MKPPVVFDGGVPAVPIKTDVFSGAVPAADEVVDDVKLSDIQEMKE